MRTNPFLDALLFLLGYDDNYKPLGIWQYPLIVLFDVMVALNIVLLIANWRADPPQRTGRNIYLWIARSLLGAMWYQGTLWKLPLPVSGGFKYWMDQIAHNAAFPAMASFYNDVLISQHRLCECCCLCLRTQLRHCSHVGLHDPRGCGGRHGAECKYLAWPVSQRVGVAVAVCIPDFGPGLSRTRYSRARLRH